MDGKTNFVVSIWKAAVEIVFGGPNFVREEAACDVAKRKSCLRHDAVFVRVLRILGLGKLIRRVGRVGTFFFVFFVGIGDGTCSFLFFVGIGTLVGELLRVNFELRVFLPGFLEELLSLCRLLLLFKIECLLRFGVLKDLRLLAIFSSCAT